MKTKQILTFVMALILFVTSLSIISCSPTDTPAESSDRPESSTPSGSQSKPSDSESAKPTETEEKLGNLPDNISIGKEIVIISRDDPWMVDEVSVEDTSGDPIDDAIFQRNLNVETMLNTTIDNVLVSGNDYCVIDEIKNTNGPDCPYHIATSSAYTCFENTASGLFRNLYDVGNIDLDQKYWATKYNEEASIGNAQYFATGAISLSLRRFIFATFFNKRLATEYGLDDLYEVVNDKKWTLEYQANIIQNMYSDIDSEEGISEGDKFGFLTDSQVFVDPYVASCDIKILVKDKETNGFIFAPEIEKLDSVMQMICNLYYDSGATYAFVGDGQYSQWTKIINKFTSGEATMITHRLIGVESGEMRNMSDPYGILPIPKYDEEQEEYYSLAHDLFTVYGVVSSVNSLDLDNVGAVLEAMAIESYKVVTPAYYEIALKGKYSKDEESWVMLDMIVNNLKINGGLLYTINLNDITQKIRTAIKNKQPNSATFMSSIHITGYEKRLNKMLSDIFAIQ